MDAAITTPFFLFFIVMWIYFRHFLNLKILWAVLTEFRTVGPYVLNWETQQYKCWISQAITVTLLACLQVLNLFWLYLIFRVLKNYILTNERKDERSDDEDEDEDRDVSTKIINNHATVANGVQKRKPRQPGT